MREDWRVKNSVKLNLRWRTALKQRLQRAILKSQPAIASDSALLRPLSGLSPRETSMLG